MASRRALALACIVGSVAVTGQAYADPTSADRETARTLMQQARDLRDKGDLKGALQRFKAADDIMHVPTTALEVARSQVALGLLVEARDFIAAIRQTPAKPSDPTPFKEARQKADALDASLDGRIPALTIAVKGTPDGEQATVAVDGTPIPAGAMGLPRSVDPGHHVVTAKSPHAEGKLEVDVKEGEQKPIEVAMVVSATPIAEAPPPETPPPAEAPPPPTRSHSPTVLTWVGVGLAGAGVIAGSVTGAMSLSKKSALSGECPGGVCVTPQSQSDYDAASTYALVSTIGFVAAGVGAAVAVVTLIVGHDDTTAAPPPAPAEGAITVHPWVGAGSAGVVGSF